MGIFNFLKRNSEEPSWIGHFPKEHVEFILGSIRENPQACKSDRIPGTEGRFGYDKTNPIPVFGIPSNEIYLRRLRKKGVSSIGWRRNGSLNIPEIINPIDEYELFDEEGELIATIYISPYHWKISELAPEGFYLEK
jgi:hypothetical protein